MTTHDIDVSNLIVFFNTRRDARFLAFGLRAEASCPEARSIRHAGRSQRVRADKMVRLFQAKSQLFAKHWRPWQVGFGVRMLQLWALSRAIAMRGTMLLGKDRRAAYEGWREVYRRRREYSRPCLASDCPTLANRTEASAHRAAESAG